METTYRIEQWSREGQILRAEYVDENGAPYSLRHALDDVDAVRGDYNDDELPLRAVQFRIVDNVTNERVDEDEARASLDPAALAQRWLTGHHSNHLTSGEDIAACLRLAADQLEKIGPISPVWMYLNFQAVMSRAAEAERRATVDAITNAVGTYAEPTEMGNGTWHYTDSHHEQSLDAIRVLTRIEAPEPTEPDEERRCACGQPWALLISGNARHEDSCTAAAAGLPELPGDIGPHADGLVDAGVEPELVDDFMDGAAR